MCVTSVAEDQKICNFLIDDLKPNSAYELELSGQNSMGFSETQRIIFRTSSLTGVNGRILNMPSTMRLKGKSNHVHLANSSLIFLQVFSINPLSTYIYNGKPTFKTTVNGDTF
ncbi:unnamed protein product [Schistosoma margrebowiei]|uniref:Fibronectin type-III domain-containing protein n=1 Tax=Schistosoma margrebowiei TaxID=48269 RepID=A0A3P7XCT9_9TREM|nr:unnamed protein product [Schistosoma margrebowiei]